MHGLTLFLCSIFSCWILTATWLNLPLTPSCASAGASPPPNSHASPLESALTSLPPPTAAPPRSQPIPNCTPVRFRKRNSFAFSKNSWKFAVLKILDSVIWQLRLGRGSGDSWAPVLIFWSIRRIRFRFWIQSWRRWERVSPEIRATIVHNEGQLIGFYRTRFGDLIYAWTVEFSSG